MRGEWDQLSIDTPELVSLEMPVAGIGSRFVAILIDYLIWAALIVGFVLALTYLGPSLNLAARLTRKWTTALLILLPFLLFWGYFALFEAFWNGRTPGKRIMRIRVIQQSGRGVGLFESLTRNLLRVVDQFPLIYGVGIVCIFLTRRHQRLGDLAAGTLVVHERDLEATSGRSASSRSLTIGLFEDTFRPTPVTTVANTLPAEALPRLGPADLGVLESFFARRLDLPLDVRTALAVRIQAALCQKAGIVPPTDLSVETFLEQSASQLRDHARIR